MKCTEQVQAVLDGRLPYSALSASGRSYISMPIYRIAREVLSKPFNARAGLIQSHPDDLQPLIKAEVTRLFNYRKKGIDR